MNDTDGIQMSFRLPSELHIPCKELAEKNGQTFAEWIRRAMREKLERDTAQSIDDVSNIELHDIIKDVVLEMKKDKII